RAPAQDHTKTGTDFLQLRLIKPGLLTGCRHSPDTAAPLFDITELPEYPGDDPIAESRNAIPHVLYRQAKRQQAARAAHQTDELAVVLRCTWPGRLGAAGA